MRSFIAIPLSDETKAALVPLQRVLQVGRQVPPDNMHLTLVFLDDQPEEVLETLHEELLTLSAPPFCVTFSGIEHLGRAIAVGVAESASLTTLHRKVLTATRRAGIALPRRRFRPHVTIARLKPEHKAVIQHAPSAHTTDSLPSMQVTGFSLYQSTLRPEGARHDELAHYILL